MSTSQPTVAYTITERLERLENFRPPPLQPTQYADPARVSLTRVSLPEDVTKYNTTVPRKFETSSVEHMKRPLHDCLINRIRSDQWPDELFEKNGRIDAILLYAQAEADRVKPSGETGISHALKTSLFDILNIITWQVIPHETRNWQVIGIGNAGKTDWGFFVNGVLTVIVELKPSKAFNSSSMTALIAHVHRQKPTIRKSFNKNNSDTMLKQIYSEFSNPTARRVKYGVLLNESVTEPAHSSSAILFQRCNNHISVGTQVLNADGLLTEDSVIQTPPVLLLALSLLPLSELVYPDQPLPQQNSGAFHANQRNDIPEEGSTLSLRSNRLLVHVPEEESETPSSNHPAVRRSERLGTTVPRPVSPTRQGDGVDHMVDADVREDVKMHDASLNVTFADHQTMALPGSSRSVRKTLQIDVPLKCHTSDEGTYANCLEIDDSSMEQSNSDTSYSTMPDDTSTPMTSPSEVALQLNDLPALAIVADNVTDSRTSDVLDIIKELPFLHGPLDWTSYKSNQQLPFFSKCDTDLKSTTLPCLQLGKLRGRGAVWYSLSAVVKDEFDNAIDSVIKLTSPSLFIDGPERENYDVSDAKQAIKNEIDILTSDISHLQGVITPRLHGIYVNKLKNQDIWAMLMEDGGDPVVIENLLFHQKKHIFYLYEKLHQAGVIHNDVDPRNWLIKTQLDGTCQFRLIDFERAVTKQRLFLDDEEDNFERYCQEEMEEVRRCLGAYSL